MTTTSPTTATTKNPSLSMIAKGGATGIGLALVANLVIFAVGNLGAPLQVVAQGDTAPSDLPVAGVIGASIVPLIVGALGLWLFERFRSNGWRIWVGLAAVVAVVSVGGPLGLDIDKGSKVALALMHLATGAAAMIGHALARRTTSA